MREMHRDMAKETLAHSEWIKLTREVECERRKEFENWPWSPTAEFLGLIAFSLVNTAVAVVIVYLFSNVVRV